MANAMKGCCYPPHIAILLHLPLLISIAAGVPTRETSPSPSTDERDALAALREALDGRFLDKTWVGIPCIEPNLSTWYGINCTLGRVTSVVLEGLGLYGQVAADALVNLTSLGHLRLRNNFISGSMMDFSSNPGMITIDLSENMFSGSISSSLLGLLSLQSLQLHNNYFTGGIPPFAEPNLTAFNVSYNKLTGKIPATPTLRSFTSSSYLGNPELCGPPTITPCPTAEKPAGPPPADSPRKEGHKLAKSPLLMAFAAVGLVGLVVSLALLYSETKVTKETKERNSGAAELGACRQSVDGGQSIHAVAGEECSRLAFMDGVGSFDIRDLLRSSAEGLGRGSFGSCYKAMLDGEQAVVVKRLRDVKPLTGEEFEGKVRVLSSMRHPNLLPPLGFYHSREEKLLIYNFAPHGNLFDRIHGARGANRVRFTWNSRLQVARGVARAMEFLHLGGEGSNAVPHGNLKSSNVLLGENNSVLVSDYGLADLIAPSATVLRMVVYRSPEYENLRMVSMKSDVWSYGCLLLELLTGRVPVQSAPRGVRGLELCEWVRRAVREEWTGEVFDLEVTGSQRRATRAMVNLLQVAVRCCEWPPEKRPEMGEVLREVEGIKADTSDDEDEDNSSDPSFV